MTLNDCILALHPTAQFGSDYIVVRNPETGVDAVTYWNPETLGPEPALSAILATPATIAQLIAYANTKQWNLATGGYTVTIGGTPMAFPTDTTSQGLITAKAVRLGQPNPPASVQWQLATGFVTIAAADFMLAAVQIADFVQKTFDVLETVLAGITGGTITTEPAIDAAAWPSNVSTVSA